MQHVSFYNRWFTFRTTAWALIILHAVGVVGMLIPISRSLFQMLTPLHLLLCLILLLLQHRSERLLRFSWIALSVFFIGFMVEVAGVHTGLIFGQYSYGSVLGPKLWDVPLMIGVNWLILSYSAWVFISSYSKIPKWLAPWLASSMLVLFDWVAEPVAVFTDMWQWHDDIIPLQNYVAWFFTALVIMHIFLFSGIKITNRLAFVLFVLQFLFFCILSLGFKFIA